LSIACGAKCAFSGINKTVSRIIASGDDDMEKIPQYKKDEEKYICPSASWGDMTGQLPTPAEDVDKRDPYNDIYPYLPEYSGRK